MSSVLHGISGGVSGLAAILIWYPLETIRFRKQIL